MKKNQYCAKIILYRNFALFYYILKKGRWIGLDLQQFRPDPRHKLENEKQYNAIVTMGQKGIREMIIQKTKYIVIS